MELLIQSPFKHVLYMKEKKSSLVRKELNYPKNHLHMIRFVAIYCTFIHVGFCVVCINSRGTLVIIIINYLQHLDLK